ncbi:MAG: hypothetical protein JRS35_19340 [Deltaproteobacteria bacterium]|nr:hypothetical protein [Deltaproteobacteria bacterium]
MRKLFALVATGFLVFGMTSAASAALMNWSGTAWVLLADYPVGVVTGGGVATINGSAGGVPAHLSTLRLAASRGGIQGTFTRIVTDPDVIANGVSALEYINIGGLTGTFAGISGGVASTSTGEVGTLGQSGLVKICLLSTACTQFLPMVFNQPTTVNGVPGTGRKGVGIGGMITAGGYGGIRISLQATPWTIKTATVIDQITPTGGGPRVMETWIAKGWAHAPASTTTSTAQVSGMVQLITPNQVTTNLPLGSSDKMGSFVIALHHFIPEPGLMLLLGSGVAGLALLGRRKMMK